jgi:L-lactate dehydrogenase complex protein LldF
MNIKERTFLHASEKAFNIKHRQILKLNISKYEQSVAKGKEKFNHFEKVRQYASVVKNASMNGIAQYLEQFETKATSRGINVVWVRDSKHALITTYKILLDNNVKLIVKSKSMITEEIGLNEFTKKMKIETIETDLGEFIVQTAGEKPYHILTPAMHKSKEDVADLFNEKFATPKQFQPHEIADFVRNHLRNIFNEADAGVTGANFIVADIGGIGLTENEGNGMMSVSFPRIHIIMAGIERIIPSVSQLPVFFQWLGVHGTGQNISAYNSLLLGPKNCAENDGPEKMYILLLDNHRSDILEDNENSTVLKCLRCGACLNVCPVYVNVGGYAYASTYTGPVGSVLTPFFSSFRDYGHLSYACTLCKRCTEVCPVKIPLHELLLQNRRKMVEKAHSSFMWKQRMKIYSYVFGNRGKMDLFTGKTKNKLSQFLHSPLGKYKRTPEFASDSFSRKWKLLNN